MRQLINPAWGYELFQSWLARELFTEDFLDFLSQLDTDEDHY
jgi:hypothetical protein